jgi:hypothetical protein
LQNFSYNIRKYNRLKMETQKLNKTYTIEQVERLVKQAWIDGNYNTNSVGNMPNKIYAISDESYWKQIKDKLL